MSQNLQKSKQQYNELLKRFKKYESFVENPEISLEEKEKWTPQAGMLTKELSNKLDEIEALGYKYTNGEVLHGFLL